MKAVPRVPPEGGDGVRVGIRRHNRGSRQSGDLFEPHERAA